MLDALFDAQSILVATADDTPAAAVVAEGELVCRPAAGNLGACTAAQGRTLLDVPTTGEAVLDTLYDAFSIVYADTDDTPAALTVGASTLVGRGAAGGIAALSAADARTVLNVEDGADVTDAANVDAAGATMNADFDAQTLLVAVSDNTPVIATINDGEFAGRPVGGNVGTVTAAQALTMLGIGDAAALLHATVALVGTAANTTTTGPFYDATNRGGYQRVTGDGDSGTGQVVYLWRVPPDFAGWDTTMLSVGHIWADATGNNVGSLVIIDTAGVTVETAAVTATATYATASVAAADLDAGTYTPDGVVTVRFDVTTDTADTADVYDLRLFWTR